ncbi:unnamed protein product [Mytilus coruscus]|uniref:Uncharacterized protein n=1 Tax=Mytilus coruscus TaxID=42192 RepID=A0A6J8B8G8_MYTCO|nr:unnamed protein product [Mytilus coruscus]
MAESATQNASIALYHYLCHNIVGSEEHVKTIRMMYNVRDNLQSNKNWTLITSGSFGEGLQMRGSDLDLMAVLKQIEVCEDTQIYFDADKIHFTMDLEDTQPGFTKLRLVHSNNQSILKDCNYINSNFYFSNLLFKQRFAPNTISTVHGPCVTDKDGLFDYASCLHCKLWIKPAIQWVTRSHNTSWPKWDVKQSDIEAARQAFMHSIELFPVQKINIAFQQLSLIN